MSFGEDTVQVALHDHLQAPLPERLKVTLSFLEKLTLTPAEVGPEDGRALLDAGLSTEAAEEAILVCFLFNMMDRLADAFDFAVPPEGTFRRFARMARFFRRNPYAPQTRRVP